MLENYSVNSQGPHYPGRVTCRVIPRPDWRLSRRMSGTQWPCMSGGREQFLRSRSLSSLCRSFLTPEPCEAPLQLQCRIFLANSSSSRLFRPRSEDSNGPSIAGMVNNLGIFFCAPSTNHNLATDSCYIFTRCHFVWAMFTVRCPEDNWALSHNTRRLRSLRYTRHLPWSRALRNNGQTLVTSADYYESMAFTSGVSEEHVPGSSKSTGKLQRGIVCDARLQRVTTGQGPQMWGRGGWWTGQ